MKTKLLLISLLFCSLISFAEKADSLWNVFNDTLRHDTIRLMAIDKIGFSLVRTNPDSAKKIAQIMLQFSVKTKLKKYQGWAYNTLGASYFSQENYSKALNYYLKSLKINVELKDKKGIGYCYNNIGLLYNGQLNYKTGLVYFFKALKIRKEIPDKGGIASCYKNMASSYSNLSDFNKALEYYDLALKIFTEIGNKPNIASCYNNIGNVYLKQKKYELAIEYFLKPIQIEELKADKKNKASCCINLGICYNEKGNYKKALYYSEMALSLSKEIGSLDKMRFAYEGLSNIYAKTNDYKKAYLNYKLFKQLTDSIFNLENSKQFSELKTNFVIEKKEAEMKIKAEAQKIIAAGEKKRHQNIIFFIAALLFFVMIFAIFIFNRFRVTRKQKNIIETQKLIVDENNLQLNQQNEEIRTQRDEIEAQRDEITAQRDLVTEQKEHIEEIHKEVTDSINYAERIQRSFLATKEILNENLNEHFVFFMPKDVVSGDFYWASKLSNGNFALATADSTGHGVPGAIMSILNISSLEKAVDQSLCNPSEILNHTRITIIERLKKDNSVEGGKDGMDASLICFDFINKKIIYSAANNPIWVIRRNTSIEFNHSELEFIELAPDKMPVGKHDKDQISFTQQEFQLQKDDIIYTLTDGMPDQFGGPKGKKFLSKNLKKLLAENCNKPMIEQKNILIKTLDDWKNNYNEKYEQTDDITILGIKIS